MSSTPSSIDLKRLSLWFWLSLCAAFVASGLMPERGAAPHMIKAATWFLGGLAPFAWLTFERRAAGQKLTTTAKYGVIFLGPAYLVAYVFRTRGFGKGITLTLVFVLKVVGVFLLAVVILGVLTLFGLVRPRL